MKSQRERARDLIELATNDGGNEKERLVAAVKAVELIKKHDLLTNPADGIFAGLGSIDNETVQSVGKVMRVVTDPDFTKSLKKIWGSAKGKRRR